MSENIRQLHLLGATGQIRTGSYDNREHLVVPVVALMEGVIHAVNAATPELVPLTSLMASPQGWNGRPVVLGHPSKDGRQVSANEPAILNAKALGTVFKSRVEGKKLLLEAWIDPVRAERVGGIKLLERLRNGETVEVSVGAFVVTEATPGQHEGKPYKAIWRDIIPDHLAFLPDTIGACSIAMGCGTHRAAVAHHQVTEKGFEVTKAEARVSKETLRKRLAALLTTLAGAKFTTADMLDTPLQADSEEQAELIGYETIQTLLDQVGASWDQASTIVKALIAAEEDEAAENPADEEAESEIEDAQLEAIQTLCMAMYGTLNSVMTVTANMLAPDSADVTRYMAAKMVDCAACNGTGSVHGNPCDVCGGDGSLKAAAGRRNSASDSKIIQGVHDHAVSLGADCTPGNYKMAEAAASAARAQEAVKPELKAACGCQGDNMKTKVERVTALMADENNPLKDQKALEAADEQGLTNLEAHCMAQAALKAAADKTAADKVAADKVAAETLKAAQDKAEDAEAKLKAAEAKQPTQEEWMAAAPAAIKTLLAEKQAEDEARKVALITSLKTAAAGVFTDEELKTKSITELEQFAALANIEKPDYSGRATPRVAAADKNSYEAPDPYAADVKALQARDSVN